jgi:hypothetical protein
MTNKSTSTKVSLFVVFVLVSAIFSVNGNVYAQQNITLSEALNVTDAAERNFANETESVPVEEELLPTTTDGLVTGDANIAAPTGEVAAEESSDAHSENATHASPAAFQIHLSAPFVPAFCWIFSFPDPAVPETRQPARGAAGHVSRLR